MRPTQMTSAKEDNNRQANIFSDCEQSTLDQRKQARPHFINKKAYFPQDPEGKLGLLTI